jgi:glycosyltransferase involved in cell wall biosynthesis
LDWHIITGEFPPEPGGVADHTWELAKALTRGTREEVHIWTPEVESDGRGLDRVHVHHLPKGFGFLWLRALDRGLARYGSADPLIVQYVPHMYGWKAMNLGFCLWLTRQRHRVLSVMFHEVAYPLKSNQPLRHRLLAVVNRVMARIVLKRANYSFTSIEPYRRLLNRLAPDVQVELMRICSNVSFTWGARRAKNGTAPGAAHKTVGVFSSFGSEISALLEPIIPAILESDHIQVQLIGPASSLVSGICKRYPQYSRRLNTTGRVPASEVGPHLTSCDLLLQLYPDGAAAARGTLVAALASGVPVVTNFGHLTEPLFKANNAVAFCDCTPLSVRNVVESLLTDNATAREIGIAGRRLYDNHFDISVAVKQLRATVEKSVISVRC